MSVEKNLITTTTSLSTSLGITILLPVCCCCFLLSSEVAARPLTIATTGAVGAHSLNNSGRGEGIDDSVSVIRTTSYTTTTTTTTTSALKSEEDDSNQNPNSITTITARTPRHRHRTGVGDNNSNNNNSSFELNSKKASNKIIDSRSSSTNSSSSTGGSSSRNKLLHTSFRLEQDVIKSLERAAATKDISLSSLVNRVLKNYVTSEMYFEELGFLLVSKNFLRRTFEGLGQEQIEELGKEYGMTIAKEYISFFYPRVNVDTLIQFVEIWFKRFQSCQHRIDENDNNNLLHYFTVNHDININFSSALQSILAELIEPIIKDTVKFTNVTPNTITFSFSVFRE